MDLLDDIFSTLGLKGALYFRTSFSAPWSVEVPAYENAARFHLVVKGTCTVLIPSGNRIVLGPGDLILIPAGQSHILSDQSVNTAPTLETVLHDADYNGSGVLIVGDKDDSAASEMVCGHLNFRRDAAHPLLNALPPCIVTTATDRAQAPLLDDLLRLISRSIFTESLGSTAAVTRMSEIVFIELIRSGMSKDNALINLLQAFRDEHVGKALELMHSTPDESWSVASLAKEVGMSRSRFSDRFSSTVGVGPMAYLTDWRLQKSLPLLENAKCSVQEIARSVGYKSSAAFTRAFSSKFGQAPTEYRRMSVP